jgi:antitoxin HicB
MNEATAFDAYEIRVRSLPDELGGGYEALFPQLARTVVGYGPTRRAAMEDLLEAAPDVAQMIRDSGQELPGPEKPRDWADFSGKFNVRVPKALHALLVRQAEEQGVSLNSLVQTLLTAGASGIEAGCAFGSAAEPGRAPTRPAECATEAA